MYVDTMAITESKLVLILDAKVLLCLKHKRGFIRSLLHSIRSAYSLRETEVIFPQSENFTLYLATQFFFQKF